MADRSRDYEKLSYSFIKNEINEDSSLDRLSNIITECFDYKTSEIAALQKQLAALEAQLNFAESAAANWGQQVAFHTENQMLLLKNIDHLEGELDKKIRTSRDCTNIVIVSIYIILIGIAATVGIMNMSGDFADLVSLED